MSFTFNSKASFSEPVSLFSYCLIWNRKWGNTPPLINNSNVFFIFFPVYWQKIPTRQSHLLHYMGLVTSLTLSSKSCFSYFRTSKLWNSGCGTGSLGFTLNCEALENINSDLQEYIQCTGKIGVKYVLSPSIRCCYVTPKYKYCKFSIFLILNHFGLWLYFLMHQPQF